MWRLWFLVWVLPVEAHTLIENLTGLVLVAKREQNKHGKMLDLYWKSKTEFENGC